MDRILRGEIPNQRILAKQTRDSRSRSLTPRVLPPAERMDLVSMRMVLPNWLTTMSSPVSPTRLMPVSGTPNMVARQGYAAGFTQGQADVSRGQAFRPTENKAYAHAKIPKGMDKDQFKTEFRESFVKGYTTGFKKV
jgi:hypothetical protein